MGENKPFKLNLGALKDNTSLEKKENISENKVSETILDTENKENLVENTTTKIEEKSVNKKAHSLDLSQMKSKKQDRLDTKKENLKSIEQTKKITKEEVIDNKEVFSNYESDFNKNKDTILEKIKKFKNFVKPKTRFGLIGLLIGATIFTVISLFIFSPKIHNFENYKINILKAKNSIECSINKTKCKKEKNINGENMNSPIIPFHKEDGNKEVKNIRNKNSNIEKLKEHFMKTSK